MAYIKNASQLLAHGNRAARRAALEIIESGLAGADPYEATRCLVNRKDNQLNIGSMTLDLSSCPQIFILGAGKATYPIAKALEEILGDRITDGIVICKYGQEGTLEHSRMLLASHPIPDESSLEGAVKTLALAKKSRPGDLIICCYTGGSSALLSLPAGDITLDEKKQVNKLLLSCGANIIEINSVRKHLSRIKGGRLAAAIHPQARLVNLTVSDVIGDPLDYITDPTVPDTSTMADARATLTRYDLWENIPATAATYLKNDDPDRETPKTEDLNNLSCHNFILVPGDAACVAAAKKAEALGFRTMILSTMLEGESRELGRTFAAVGNEIVQNGRPLPAPCVVIGGGETTVRLDTHFGMGGPNQEFALGAAFDICGRNHVLVAGIDSDGTDGPTDLAGALVDGQTLQRAEVAGLDLRSSLKNHNVSQALEKLGDSVITGATGTNVNDLKLLLVMNPKGKS
ncbi:MAG: DUF4147 domain-containing protein [Desulfobacula sp.]|jgi:glycerate 2-kinase|nr:DUF4147 domain-containing protein [Desulfobacula sp.]